MMKYTMNGMLSVEGTVIIKKTTRTGAPSLSHMLFGMSKNLKNASPSTTSTQVRKRSRTSPTMHLPIASWLRISVLFARDLDIGKMNAHAMEVVVVLAALPHTRHRHPKVSFPRGAAVTISLA